MVGNFRCSRRPAGSERSGLKLGRHQPLFHFPSLGCYVTCLWGILFSIHALRPSVWAFI